MTTLRAWIDGIGVLGPGLHDWRQARAVLRGDAPYVPAATVLPTPAALPPAERRRASAVVRLCLACGLEAVEASGLAARELATVFASSGGDNANCHTICETLASDDRLLSPTRFHNSVHNVASGYWGIATGAMAPSAVLGAHDASAAAGLLEALATVSVGQQALLLLIYDTAYPEPLRAARPTNDSFAAALVLHPRRGPRSLGRIALDASAPWTEAAADGLAQAELEALRRGIPAAQTLPLLAALARGADTTLALEHGTARRMAVHLAPP